MFIFSSKFVFHAIPGVHTGFTVWGGGGGGKLKTFGVYVMGVHKQAPSSGDLGAAPQFFFVAKSMLSD